MFMRPFIQFLSILVISLAASAAGYGQIPAAGGGSNSGKDLRSPSVEVRVAGASSAPENWIAGYVDPIQGSSSIDLVRRALTSNAQLATARLEINRASARLRQAGLRPNPTVDFEQLNGVFGSPGERGTTIGFSLPLELWGQRGRRMDLARAELEASEAEVADRERRLASEARAVYVEALAALRDLEVTERLYSLDVETARIVEARVEEGDAAPLELNLLRTEVDRLRARRALIEGRLEAAALRLKQIVGIPQNETLRLREALDAPLLPAPPASLDAAIEIALRTRPDLRLARLNELVALAGYRLAKAQAAPQVTAFVQYSNVLGTFDDTPIGVLSDRDRIFDYGVSITLPILNRNQGAKAEAQIAITQAQRRREFTESLIRAEVAAAYRRYEAAQASIQTYERGVIARSEQNVQTMRAAYQVGAFRVTELLVEQRRMVDSQREMTEALAERYRALSDLRAAMGITD
ncbi:MAG: TolC family protein [Acidobacteria bacterium]|nr:TolC family protein [Acidobacteriota bacterium]